MDSKGDDINQLKNDYPKYVDAVVRAVEEYIRLGPSSGTYVVKAGDSLWSIAKKFNTTVDEIKRANNLTSNSLNIGQVLKIPQALQPEIPPENIGFYIVKSGDSLYKIAQLYNTTVDNLMKLNNLTSTSLKIGQQLKVPSLEEPPAEKPYISYTVKVGDSLYSIAAKYNTTVNEIMTYNNLTSNLLNIGQVLKIPTGSVEPSPPLGQPYISYIVKSGDSLYKLANTYNTTVDAIMRLNNLSSTVLSIGQILKIPSSNGTNNPEIRYVVKSGDSLYKIAQLYNTTVDAIKRRNNLTSNNLSVGQVLIIE